MTRRLPFAVLLLLAAPALAQAPPPGPAPRPSPAPTPAPGQAPPPAPGPEWLPRGAVELQALDKVTARSRVLSGPIGQKLAFGSLSITATACLVRPPDQRQDAAAYLDITDAHPNSPSFHGWMLASEPALSMLEHPLYDIRLTACRP